MKRIMTTLGAVMFWTTTAMAATGQDAEGMSFLTVLFIGFGALIVAGQVVPGLVIFYGMVKGLFLKTAKRQA